MAILCLSVPHETARLLGEIKVPGEAVSHHHVTIHHFGDDVSIEDLAEITIATYKVLRNTRPFTVSTSRVGCFQKNPSGVPVLCRIDSDELHELWERLGAAYDKRGVDYSKKFPEFKPHVTLSYAEEEFEDFRIPTVEWGAHELVLWGGDDGDRRLLVTFPLSLEARVARRYASGF